MLKFLVVAVVVIVGLWLLLRGRGVQRPGPTRKAAPPSGPEDMVACARCGLHLPAGESVPDAQGNRYCGAEHRDAGPR